VGLPVFAAEAVVGGAAEVGTGWAVVGAVVVLVDEDDLLLEPHAAAVRLITVIPAPMYINHGRTLILAPFRECPSPRRVAASVI
jgi:hypothetical protein